MPPALIRISPGLSSRVGRIGGFKFVFEFAESRNCNAKMAKRLKQIAILRNVCLKYSFSILEVLRMEKLMVGVWDRVNY